MRSYLGVDGGGTKTALCVLSESGELLASLQAPSCYYLEAAITEGTALVERVLTEAVAEVCSSAGVPPIELTSAFFGLPGYGEAAADVEVLDSLPATILGHRRYCCDNDMVCGWAGSLGLADGINVVSGTGSILYGRRGSASARVGGWGELFGDEGSGYWIGIRALQACSQMRDGRLEAGLLADLVTERLALASPLELVDVVHRRWGGDRRRIAALSRLVVDAARRGDRVAAGILDAAAGELVRMVETSRRLLGFGDSEPVPVSYSGGVFAADEVQQGFGDRLTALSADYDVRTPMLSPVIGAAVYAAHRDDPAIARRLVSAVR
jgi:N-acetylglucosamine kinase-like BadF-type ATPase